MWLLKASLSDNIFWAKPGAEFLIGRNAQVNIRSSDTSISRRHAKITCSTIDPFESATSTLHIFSDKVNAVFVNGKPIPPSTEFPLNNGDIILVGSNQEGSYNFEITVSKQVYSLCLSGMSDLEAKKFAAIASSADIHLTHSFNSKTTHLLMNSIRVTFKVIISLLNCIPIVNPEWLTALLNLNSNNYIKIETLKYVPKLGEKLEYPVSFEPNKARQRLLKELTFIVFSKDEFNHLNQIIPLAGGDLLLFSDPITILEKFLSTLKAPRIFVPSKSSPLYSKVLEITKRNAKFIRVITENDIGNAILSCDLDHVNVSNSDHLNIESIYADSQDESQSSFLKPVPVVSQPANVNSMNSYQSQAPDSMFSKLATSQLKDSRIPIQKKFSFLSNLDSLLDDDSPAVTSYRSNTVNRSNTVQLKPITHSESRKLDSIAEKATGISLYTNDEPTSLASQLGLDLHPKPPKPVVVVQEKRHVYNFENAFSMGDKSLDSQEDAPVDRDGDSQEDFPVDRKRKTTIEQESRTKVRRKQAIVSSDEEMADKSRTIHSESEPEPEMLPEEPIRPFVSGSPPPQCRIQKQVPILSKKELAKIKKQKLLDAPDIGLKGSKKNHVYDSGDDCSADEIDFTGLRNMSKVVFAPIIVKPQLLIEDVEYDENIVNVKPFKKNAVVEGDIIPLVAYKKQDLFVKGFKILKQKREKQVKVYGTKKLSKTVKGGKVIGDEKLLIESSGDSDASIPVSGQSEDDEDDGVFSRPKTASNSARQSVDLNHSSRSRSQSLEIEEEEEDVVTKPKSKRAIIVDEDSEEDVAFTKKPKAKPAPKMKPATKSRSTIVIESDDSDDAVFKKPKPSQRLNR